MPAEGHPDWRPVGHDGRTPVRFARDELSRDKLDEFFRLLRTGAELELAARADEVGSSGLRMRRYMEREPAFKVEVEAALAEGYALYRDRLRSTVRTRATALEGGSDRLLEVELATHVPGYEHLRRDRVKVDGKIQHEHEHAIVLDTRVFTQLSPESLDLLERLFEEMATIEGEARELGPGE